MKLWILRTRAARPSPADCVFGFVVRAETPEEARRLASKEVGDEGRVEGGSAWTNPKKTTCQELKPEGEPGVVMCDFFATA